MFKKITAIEPVSIVPEAVEELRAFGENLIMYDDIPENDDEIVRRIGDADAVLLSYTSSVNRYVLEKCKNLRYIGMCCSLYSEESANVDIAFAREQGIAVYGIRDYGDRGVVEYVISELVRLLHGFDRKMWKDIPVEITGLKTGIIGMGTSGAMIAEALQFMGADVSYYSRSRKPQYEEKGMKYGALNEVLQNSEVIFTCLNKNVILLHKDEFDLIGNGKILFNTSIGPSFDIEALREWLNGGDNYFICDTRGAGGNDDEILSMPNTFCADTSAGRTKQAFELLSKKVLDNIRKYQENRLR